MPHPSPHRHALLIDPTIARFFDHVDQKPETTAMLVAVPLHCETLGAIQPLRARVVQQGESREVTGYIKDNYPEFYTFSALGVTLCPN